MSRSVKRAILAAMLVAAAGTGCYDLPRRAWDLPPFTHGYSHVDRLLVPMRDGVRLVTQVFHPEGGGPWPVLLIRNPYNYRNHFAVVAKFFVRYGYAVVLQDCRGRFDSEGEWNPIVNERDDGIDTLAWLTAQPWQNGSIGFFGMSYLALVQWVVADALPPEVKTLIPIVVGTRTRTLVYERGMFRHELGTAWAALMPDHGMGVFNGDAYQAAIRHRPAIEIDEKFFGNHLPWFRQWLTSEDPTAPLWNREDAKSLESMPARVDVPVLILEGWYDIFAEDALAAFMQLKSRARSEMFVGPWTHIQGFAGDGDKDFSGSGGVGIQMRRIVNWLGHHLKGEPLANDARGAIAAYEIGAGVYRRFDAWPPPTRPLRFYLGGSAPEGAACLRGTLSPEPPESSGAFGYVYDPEDPVPTSGGSRLLAFALPFFGGAKPSSVVQPGTCYRRDVISFISDALSEELHLAGKVRVGLRVASDAPDTAFTAKLIEIAPNGFTVNIQDGIISLGFREEGKARQPYTPGTPVDVEIELPPILWRLPPHARLRLDVSSSNFPAYHAHPNTARPWALEEAPVPARQRVFTGAEGGWIELPVREERD